MSNLLPVTLPAIVATIYIHPRCNNSASVTVIIGPPSDGDQVTFYNGSNESKLIYALQDARKAYPNANVVWEGWKYMTVRDFANHPASVLCLRFESDVFLHCGNPSDHVITAVH